MVTPTGTLLGTKHQVIRLNVALPAAFQNGGCVGDENGKRTARSPSVHNHSTICPSPDEERINALLTQFSLISASHEDGWYILHSQMHI